MPLGTASIVEKPTKFKMSAVGTPFIFFKQMIFSKNNRQKKQEYRHRAYGTLENIIVVSYNRVRA